VEKLLLRPEEAAQMLGLGRAQVYGMCQRGELPCVRLGRSVRIPADRLRSWLEDKQTAPERLDPEPAGQNP
jgi:excisionase family DNA binding protein